MVMSTHIITAFDQKVMVKLKMKWIVAIAAVIVVLLLITDCLCVTAESIPEVDVNKFRPLIQGCLDTVQDMFSLHKEHLTSVHNRPFVTLSYAQSLDGKVALTIVESSNDGGRTTTTTSSSNLPISGIESLYLTHALRSQHDAILIGGKTWSIDNPRLTNRLWDTNNNNNAVTEQQQQQQRRQQQQPRPVVLDPNLKYLSELGDGTIRAKNVIVCCSMEAAKKHRTIPHSVTLLPCPLTADHRLDLVYILSQLLQRYGIHSVMVEGGPTVLTAFANEGLVDLQCVTIAPKLFGTIGLPSFTNVHQSKKSPPPQQDNDVVGICLGPLRCFNLGSDCIVLTKWR